MAWLLPTKGRIDNLKRFLRASRELGQATPGFIVVNIDEYVANDGAYHDALRWGTPGLWSILPVEATSYGEAVRLAWPVVEHDPWIGLLADDLVPTTAGWDTALVAHVAQGWNLVSANDGAQANADIAKGRLHGAICWAGDLARAVGWIFPPTLRHVFHDDVWETLGRETGCWQTRMEVVTRHLHAFYETGERGPTMDPSSELWQHDEAWFKEWLRTEKDHVVARIKAHMALRGVTHRSADFTGVHLMLATPSASGRPELNYVRSLLATNEFLRLQRDVQGNPVAKLSWATEQYTADISLARLKLFGMFLRSTCTHLLMVDDDMGWGMDAIIRLFHAKKDFAAIAGPKKRYPLQFAVSYTAPDGTPGNILETWDNVSGTLRATEIGAAFVLLTRAAAEKIAAGYPELQCDGFSPEGDVAVFNPMVWNRRYFSEDFAFCKRVQALGIETHVVPDVALTHTGSHQFEGSLMQYFEAQTAAQAHFDAGPVLTQQFAEAAE